MKGVRTDRVLSERCLDEESEDGSVEYKWWLAAPSDRSRLERLATQMNFRVNEGDGRCTYVLGVPQQSSGGREGIRTSATGERIDDAAQAEFSTCLENIVHCYALVAFE